MHIFLPRRHKLLLGLDVCLARWSWISTSNLPLSCCLSCWERSLQQLGSHVWCRSRGWSPLQGIRTDYSTHEITGRWGWQITTQSPDCCCQWGLRGRSPNNKFNLVNERQVDSCQCPFSLCPELIALIPSPSRKFCLFWLIAFSRLKKEEFSVDSGNDTPRGWYSRLALGVQSTTRAAPLLFAGIKSSASSHSTMRCICVLGGRR